MELLRFLSCGGVDHGKSTLIGRLLYDSDVVYADQLDAIRRDSKRYSASGEEIDFSLLVDGLEAEREQGITIDVAFRYFSTAKRKFIIADVPGHDQYTRNMATGASTCDLAVVVVDARKGIVEQTRRHAFVASLLGIKHLVLCINKMDLVEWQQSPFEAIRSAFVDFSAKLEVTNVDFIPLCARSGDNVVRGSERMPWYRGRPLLDFLENVYIASDRNLIDLRFPIQLVLRTPDNARRLAGTIASGVIRKGDEAFVIPSGTRSRVAAIELAGTELAEAFAPMAVSVTLEDDLDVGRGDMLVHPQNVPVLAREFEALVVWMAEHTVTPSREYLVKHLTTTTPGVVADIRYKIDVHTLRRQPAGELRLNEIGRVRIEVSNSLAFDPYTRNRGAGAFILIDSINNETVAAGMILARQAATSPSTALTDLADREGVPVTPTERSVRLGQSPLLIWFHGDAASIASELERELFDHGFFTYLVEPAALAHMVAANDFGLLHALMRCGAVSIVVGTGSTPSASEMVVPSGAVVEITVVEEGGADTDPAEELQWNRSGPKSMTVRRRHASGRELALAIHGSLMRARLLERL